MAFKEVDIEPIKLEDGDFWSPKEIGDWIEGNICDWDSDNYGNQRIILETTQYGSSKKTDFQYSEGNEPQVQLPTHAHLRRYYVNLETGDYIKVTLNKIVPSNSEGYSDKKEYSVLKDETRGVDYE